jgi:hypothetical protein
MSDLERAVELAREYVKNTPECKCDGCVVARALLAYADAPVVAWYTKSPYVEATQLYSVNPDAHGRIPLIARPEDLPMSEKVDHEAAREWAKANRDLDRNGYAYEDANLARAYLDLAQREPSGGVTDADTVHIPSDADRARVAAGNTRPSITEGVPEGWALVTLEPFDSDEFPWRVLLSATTGNMTAEGDTVAEGYGPTPESAISDAANKARMEGKK